MLFSHYKNLECEQNHNIFFNINFIQISNRISINNDLF